MPQVFKQIEQKSATILLNGCTNPQEQELSSLLLSLPQKSAHLQQDDDHSFLSRLTN